MICDSIIAKLLPIEEHPQPREGVRRRLVPRDQERRHLVAQLDVGTLLRLRRVAS